MGNLLSPLMLERRMRRQLGDRWERLDHERVGTWWRVWGMPNGWPADCGALFWREDAWRHASRCWRNSRAGGNYNSCLPRQSTCSIAVMQANKRRHADGSITVCYQRGTQVYLAHMPWGAVAI